MAPCEQVQMDVKHRLSCLAVAVEHRPVPALVEALLSCDRRRSPDELSHERLVFCSQVVCRRDVFLRHNQDMEWRLWVDVVEGEDVDILEHLR